MSIAEYRPLACAQLSLSLPLPLPLSLTLPLSFCNPLASPPSHPLPHFLGVVRALSRVSEVRAKRRTRSASRLGGACVDRVAHKPIASDFFAAMAGKTKKRHARTDAPTHAAMREPLLPEGSANDASGFNILTGHIPYGTSTAAQGWAAQNESLDFEPVHSRTNQRHAAKALMQRKFYGYTGNTLVKYLVTIGTGLFTGACAYAITQSSNFILSNRLAMTQTVVEFGGRSEILNLLVAFCTLCSTGMATLVVPGLLVQLWTPQAAGAGVSLVMAYLNGNHIPYLLHWHVMLTKILGTICACASSLPLGPEGPMVQVSAPHGPPSLAPHIRPTIFPQPPSPPPPQAHSDAHAHTHTLPFPSCPFPFPFPFPFSFPYPRADRCGLGLYLHILRVLRSRGGHGGCPLSGGGHPKLRRWWWWGGMLPLPPMAERSETKDLWPRRGRPHQEPPPRAARLRVPPPRHILRADRPTGKGAFLSFPFLSFPHVC